jgi:hypothetical protein
MMLVLRDKNECSPTRSNPEFYAKPWALQRVGRDQIAGYISCQLAKQKSSIAGYSQGILQVLVDLHDSSLVAASVAIVWRWTSQSKLWVGRQSPVPENIVTTFLSWDQL